MINLFSRPFVISSDHGGFTLKQSLIEYMQKKGIENFKVLGAKGLDRIDYPPIVHETCQLILKKEVEWAVMICGTGIGNSIAANRFKGIHCAPCHDITTARLARAHNNANILSLGGRIIGNILAQDILEAFAETQFLGDRYALRQKMIDETGSCI